MPQFTDSRLDSFFYVRAQSSAHSDGECITVLLEAGNIKVNGFRLRAECPLAGDVWLSAKVKHGSKYGRYRYYLVNSVDYEPIFLQNILITCQLNNDQSMRPLLYFNGARVPQSARTVTAAAGRTTLMMRSQVILQDH